MQTLAEIAVQVGLSAEPALIVLEDGSRFVVQREADYEELLREAEENRFVEAINEGIADMEAGRMRPADEAMAEVMRHLGLQD